MGLKTSRTGGNVDVAARNHAFTMAAPAEGETRIDSVIGANGDYLLVQLAAVNYPQAEQLPAATRQSVAASLTESSATRSFAAYQKWILDQLNN